MTALGEWLYGIWAGAAAVVYAVAWLPLRLFGGRDLRERFGELPGSIPRGATWLHAASVGEVTALAPFVRELRRRFRGPLAISVMTATGRAQAKALFGLPVAFAPVDAPPAVRRWLERAAPRALIVAETELWPVWMRAMSARGPVLWVNGRISDRSFPKYRLVAPLMAAVFARFSRLIVISDRDRRRAVALGAPSRRIDVAGNLKLDALAPAIRAAGVPAGRWLVAGSTRPGEEAVLLDALRRVRTRHPRAGLILAPRHPRRVGEVEELIRGAGFSCARRSRGRRPADVILVDTLGELAALYRAGFAAFVGGTLAPIGGHNVLEPAVAGVPVVFGPSLENVREDAAGLVSARGAVVVRDAAALARIWSDWLDRPVAARDAGRRARGYVRSRQGVAKRVVKILREGGWI